MSQVEIAGFVLHRRQSRHRRPRNHHYRPDLAFQAAMPFQSNEVVVSQSYRSWFVASLAYSWQSSHVLLLVVLLLPPTSWKVAILVYWNTWKLGIADMSRPAQDFHCAPLGLTRLLVAAW